MELSSKREDINKNLKYFSFLLGGVLIGMALKSPLTQSREKIMSSITTDTTKILFDSTSYKEGVSDGKRIGFFEGTQEVYNAIHDKHGGTIDSITLSNQSQPENNH